MLSFAYKHGNSRLLNIILSTGPRGKLLFNHFITLFSWSLITITSTCFPPYFSLFSLSLSLFTSLPRFQPFWHLLDSDKQGSKYLASLLFPSSLPFSHCLLSLSLPALHGFTPMADLPSLLRSELLGLSTFSHHFSSRVHFFSQNWVQQFLCSLFSSAVICSSGVLA